MQYKREFLMAASWKSSRQYAVELALKGWSIVSLVGLALGGGLSIYLGGSLGVAGQSLQGPVLCV